MRRESSPVMIPPRHRSSERYLACPSFTRGGVRLCGSGEIRVRSCLASALSTTSGVGSSLDEVRILMTGDLNFRSQALLLKRWPAHEFACHVGKACHHGADDISWKFLKAMSPIATLFSSGDQETHVHPRALVMGMCARVIGPRPCVPCGPFMRPQQAPPLGRRRPPILRNA